MEVIRTVGKNNYKLKLSATDNVDVAYYEIYVDGSYYGTTGEEWTPPNNFSSCNTTFRAVDLAGNKGAFSSGQHIHMDTEAPSKTTVSLNGYTSATWTNRDDVQNFNASDNVGVAYYEYAHSTGASSATKVSNPWTINWDGNWKFYVRAVDQAGNRGAWSNAYTVKRNTVLPTVNITLPNSTQNQVSLQLNDDIGLTGYAVTSSSSQPSSWTSLSSTSATPSYSFAQNTATYYAWVKDAAGNVNSKKFTITANKHTHTDSCYATCGGTYYIEWSGDDGRGWYRWNLRCNRCGSAAYSSWHPHYNEPQYSDDHIISRHSPCRVSRLTCGKSTTAIESYTLSF